MLVNLEDSWFHSNNWRYIIPNWKLFYFLDQLFYQSKTTKLVAIFVLSTSENWRKNDVSDVVSISLLWALSCFLFLDLCFIHQMKNFDEYNENVGDDWKIFDSCEFMLDEKVISELFFYDLIVLFDNIPKKISSKWLVRILSTHSQIYVFLSKCYILSLWKILI